MKEQEQVPGRTVSGSRLDIAKIKARCERATPGEWTPSIDGTVLWSGDVMVFATSSMDGLSPEQRKANVEFAAHAREDLPAALEALGEAQAALRALSWQEPDGTRHWCESAARGESDIAVNDCNCDEARAILGESG